MNRPFIEATLHHLSRAMIEAADAFGRNDVDICLVRLRYITQVADTLADKIAATREEVHHAE